MHNYIPQSWMNLPAVNAIITTVSFVRAQRVDVVVVAVKRLTHHVVYQLRLELYHKGYIYTRTLT